jgi:hypothetical protein
MNVFALGGLEHFTLEDFKYLYLLTTGGNFLALIALLVYSPRLLREELDIS